MLDEEHDNFLHDINISKYHLKTEAWLRLQALNLPYSNTGGSNILFIVQLQNMIGYSRQ